MNPKDFALMFYVAGAKDSFQNLDIKKIEQLAKEISAISLTIDITKPKGSYNDKDLKYAVGRAKDWNNDKPLSMVKFDKDESFSIVIDGKAVKENVSCMQLMGIMAYCVDRVKGGQLKDMAGFDFLKAGLQM